MKSGVFAGVLVAIATQAIAAEVVSPAPDTVTATLYQSYRGYPDIALITETRTVDLPAGDTVIRFDGVASTLIAQTALLSGLPAPPHESDYDYDLFDPATILRKSVGQPAELIETRPKAAESHRTGILVSDQGVVAFKDDAGVETLGCGGPPARLIVGVPAGLRSRPSLSVHVPVSRAGAYRIGLSYLAGGMRWHAVYIVRFARDRRHFDLEGRIVLDNRTETGFQRMPTRFVAGEVLRLTETSALPVAAAQPQRDCWGLERTTDIALRSPMVDDAAPMAKETRMVMAAAAPRAAAISGGRDVSLEKLGDLKLYRLEEPVHVAARQQKLFGFISRRAVKTEPSHAVVVSSGRSVYGISSRLVWRVRNSRTDGLGKPIPHGSVVLFAADHAYLGEDQLRQDVPEGGDFELAGAVSDEVVFDDEITSAGQSVETHRLTLRNTTDAKAGVAVHLPTLPAVRLLSGLDGAMAWNGSVVWTTTLRPREIRSLSFVTQRGEP
ncbi:hypothetical protein [Telmatospirillum sp.]|uniref:DUF4139 domain-containing protein n=1 Tax=Telmatospirillum sp. TaxID=2079197 RepID=UPI00283CCBAE|nr:hypothetical protein [Telmatospirillum sp.]MDR3438678.1 hypothetical protein [Telmatospirillum sp.]